MGRLVRFLVVVVLAGAGAGLVAACLVLFLHGLELLAFGHIETPESPGVGNAAPWRIVVALAAAGVLAGVGWWALRRWGRKVVSVNAAVGGTKMPPVPTILNALLQILIVGLGASVGREVAPRELGALVGGWLSDLTRLSARERKIIVASAAGAGLAGVYSVPLGGAVFAIEILLAEFSVIGAVAAFLTSAIATLTASFVVSSEAVYIAPQIPLSWSLIIWAAIIGPIAGALGLSFMRGVAWAEKRRPKNWTIMIVMPVVFTIVGLIAIQFPQILGNGRAAAQLGFDQHALVGAPLLFIAAILILKPLATIATIGSGGTGGTLTPSIAIGGLLGVLAGAGWTLLWPGVPLVGFALVGAAAFLASTMRAPLTALVLIIEFSHQGTGVFVPMMIAIAGAIVTEHFLTHKRLIGID
jgi:CIC family chloride channel protein